MKNWRTPLLLRLGTDLGTCLTTSGKAKQLVAGEQSEFGPARAQIVSRYNDTNGEEVCFANNDRKEYVRFDAQEQRYWYPEPDLGGWADEVAQTRLRRRGWA